MPIFPTDTASATPASGDIILIADVSDSNNPKDCTLAELPISTATQTALDAKQDVLTGLTASVTELNYTDGVTSSIQTQLDGKQATITGLTASGAELNILDGATLTTTELNYVDGVTSSIQTQLDGKQAALTGLTATVTELNYTDGVTSSIQTQINSKQDTLVSATNIKTINGNSVLGSGDLTITGGGGSGDVVGPASATDNAIARFDTTTGKLLQNSGASIDDSGNITATNLSGTNTGDQPIATSGEVDIGTDNTKIITPLALAGSSLGINSLRGVASSVDSEIVLFSSTTGKVTKRATTTGILKGTSGVLSAATAGTDYVAPSGALGTPSSGTLTNCTGLPLSGVVDSTSEALGVGTLEVGHASDTTLSRSAAGQLAMEGVDILSTSNTKTVTNKRITKRVETVSSSATPASNTDNYDVTKITSLATAITSMTTNLTGTPNDGDLHLWSFTDNGTARSITPGASFENSTVSFPTTTVISTRIDVLCIWNSATSKWRVIAVS